MWGLARSDGGPDGASDTGRAESRFSTTSGTRPQENHVNGKR
jgi:hypothetical protein